MPGVPTDRSESLLKQYWRPFMAYQYGAVCIFDFIIAPLLSFTFAYLTKTPYVPWDPITLKDSGFYHMGMASICGVSAWTRGQEKIARMGQAGDNGDPPGGNV